MKEMAFDYPKTHLFHFALFLVLILRSANVEGLNVGFYANSCPLVESITSNVVKQTLSVAPSLSGPLLKMFFHDCFVRGCDASILLDSPTNQAEKDADPNKTFRSGFEIIDRVKSALEMHCPGIVSCADIIALVSRDVVVQTGGASWEVETGRRDGRVSLRNEAFSELPSAASDITFLKLLFLQKGLSVKDLVVLSGAHTLGISHCAAFKKRLYNFDGTGDINSTDPKMDPNYVAALRKKCTNNNNDTFVQMDPGSSKVFDGHYYELVSKRRGLLESDAALLDDDETRKYVETHKIKGNQRSFFKDFAISMVNLGRVSVLTGNAGEIRKVCSRTN
ncbi:peroxidase 27 [Beta vulgaris subsp. vulgaris]|uniref:peroxidase 27 n=1 Tax=Beta vulgaris subsp. vulgaris TaxID=3555 RepID=UPI002036A04C|nr:peroxidase 27 [Beta vulgaris subsp. vulgaris]